MQAGGQAAFAVGRAADIAFAFGTECAPALTTIRQRVVKRVIGAFHGITLLPVPEPTGGVPLREGPARSRQLLPARIRWRPWLGQSACLARNPLPAPQVSELPLASVADPELPEARFNLIHNAEVVIKLLRASLQQVALPIGPVHPGARVQIFHLQTSQVQPGSVDDNREREHRHGDGISDARLQHRPDVRGDSLAQVGFASRPRWPA